MIYKLICIVIFFIVLLSFSQTLVLGSYLIGKESYTADLVKNAIMDVCPSIYEKALNSPIYYSGKYDKTDRIDIITPNHMSSIDFMIVLSIIRQYDDRNVYFLLKKQVALMPGIGFILLSGLDIKLNRKIEEDELNIINTIKRITSGIIFIMPEGTRYTAARYEAAKQFSITNNLDVFKNTLYPKMKGLYTICNALIQENKMGNIIDISIVIEHFRNKQIFMSDIINAKKPFGNTFGVVNSYVVPMNIPSYDKFKEWYIELWRKKDNTLENISMDITKYNRLDPKIATSNYILLVFIISLSIYLIINTSGMYLVYSLLLSYIVSFIKYKNL